MSSNGNIHFGSYDNYLYSLSSAGALNWRYLTGSWIDSTPAINGQLVYFGGGDSYMYALNIGTGALVWKTLTGGSIESSPCIGSDGIVYVGSSDGKVYAFNGATGAVIFSYNIGSGVDSSPAVRVGRVTTCTGLFWIVRRTCHSAVTDPPSLFPITLLRLLQMARSSSRRTITSCTNSTFHPLLQPHPRPRLQPRLPRLSHHPRGVKSGTMCSTRVSPQTSGRPRFQQSGPPYPARTSVPLRLWMLLATRTSDCMAAKTRWCRTIAVAISGGCSQLRHGCGDLPCPQTAPAFCLGINGEEFAPFHPLMPPSSGCTRILPVGCTLPPQLRMG